MIDVTSNSFGMLETDICCGERILGKSESTVGKEVTA